MALKRILLVLLAAAALATPALGQQNNLPPTQLALELQFYPNVAPRISARVTGQTRRGLVGAFSRAAGDNAII